MKFNIITLLPEMFRAVLSFGVIGRALSQGIASVNLVNPRDFAKGVHQAVDDRPFGGGDGMILMAEPLGKSLDFLNSKAPTYCLSPQGQTFDESLALKWSEEKEITLVCGRYAGLDQRFLIAHGVQEISVGDYVVSGGELPALIIVDAIMRKIPGVLGHKDSALMDSLAGDQGLLEAPHFTRPREYGGLHVPEVFLSGDHEKIKEYRYLCSLLVTLQKKPQRLQTLNINWPQLESFLLSLREEELSAQGFSRDEMLSQIKKNKQTHVGGNSIER